MAHNESGLLGTKETYTLGDYEFRLSVSAASVMALCHNNKTGKSAAKGKSWSSQLQVDGWYVEANETEASVYVASRYSSVPNVNTPLNTVTIYNGMPSGTGFTWFVIGGDGVFATDGSTSYICARSYPPSGDWDFYCGVTAGGRYRNRFKLDQQYTYRGQTVYYHTSHWSGAQTDIPGLDVSANFGSIANTAWAMVYGLEDDGNEQLVARFAIDLREAGGGPGGWSGGVWDEPGDVEPVDWEPGDPTHTLTLTVTGALSGRHNDPLFDTSYSYIPADQDSVKDYGCGGDGGHGGGGGGGASTVIVRQFATDRASSKEIKAYARRHGYGSGGGKGGTGGDGCILIFY